MIGALGEDIACRYLESKGYIISTRNYWKPWGEIDIVASYGEVVHFVEVKSVTRETFGSNSGYRPEDNLHPWKLKRMARVIQTFVLEHDVKNWQFDVLTVLLRKEDKMAKVELLENVVL